MTTAPDEGDESVPERENREDGYTISVPFCERCPDKKLWPMKHLILGTCPECGRDDRRAWRVARARRLIHAKAAR